MRGARPGHSWHRASAWPRLWTALVVCACGLGTAARASDEPNDQAASAVGRQQFHVDSAGHRWRVLVHVPTTYDPSRPPPVVLVLHGSGGTSESALDGMGWAAKAEAEGFLAVAPEGQPLRAGGEPNVLLNARVWNSGQYAPDRPRARVNDVAFFNALLDELPRRWTIDPDRIYVAGHSNGAAMAFRIAAELSERIAAVGAVAGLCWVKDPSPTRGVPTLFIVGTDDPLVRLDGGLKILPWEIGRTPPVSDNLAHWAQAIGAAVEPTVRYPSDNVLVHDYPPVQADGALLRAVYILGHGHSWPGSRGFAPERLLGPNTNALQATSTLWTFFTKHGLRPSKP